MIGSDVPGLRAVPPASGGQKVAGQP